MNGRRRGEVGFFPTRNRTPEPYLKADHILIILGGQSHLEKRLVATPLLRNHIFLFDRHSFTSRRDRVSTAWRLHWGLLSSSRALFVVCLFT